MGTSYKDRQNDPRPKGRVLVPNWAPPYWVAEDAYGNVYVTVTNIYSAAAGARKAPEGYRDTLRQAIVAQNEAEGQIEAFLSQVKEGESSSRLPQEGESSSLRLPQEDE